MYLNSEITPKMITTTRAICLARASSGSIQHVDEIEDEDNDEKGDEYTDQHAGPLGVMESANGPFLTRVQ